jgi:hypothetical protein
MKDEIIIEVLAWMVVVVSIIIPLIAIVIGLVL